MLLVKVNKEPATTPRQRGQPALATSSRALTSAPNQKQRPSPQPVTPITHSKHKTPVSTPAAPLKQSSMTLQTISASPKATKSELQSRKSSEQYLFHQLLQSWIRNQPACLLVLENMTTKKQTSI